MSTAIENVSRETLCSFTNPLYHIDVHLSMLEYRKIGMGEL